MAVSTLGRSTPASSSPTWLSDLASSSAAAARPALVSATSCRLASAAERCLVTRPSASNRPSTRLRYPASMSRARRRSATRVTSRRAISYSSRASVSEYGMSRYMPCTSPMTLV